MRMHMGIRVLALMTLGAAAWAETVDMVVATVDNEVILYSDILEDAGPLIESLRLETPNAEVFQREADKALKEALDQSVERKILYRQAQLASLEVSDADVEARIDRIRKRYASSDEFQRLLEESGETMGDFRQRMRQQIMAISMGARQRNQFEQQVVVSEEELRQYYADHEDEFSRAERVQLRRIFLAAGRDGGERAKVKARLEALREEAALGADFGELALTYSEGPEQDERGLVGWVERGDLVPALEEAAFALEAGGVSGVVEIESGFAILKVERREAAGKASYEEARTEIEPKLRAQAAQQRYKKWMEDLRKRSRVRVFL